MRKALNENPTVQLAVLGIVGVIFAIILYMSVLSGGGAEPETVTGADLAAPVAPASPSTPAAPAAPAPSAPAPSIPAEPTPGPAASAVDGEGLVASKGLPEKVLVPLARGKAVALLVVDPKAASDRKVRSYLKALSGRGGVAVLVVKAGQIARYSRITRGVSVSRTPALVVVSPRARSGELTAEVKHGFRGAKSITIALEDALYKGGTRSASP